MSERLLLLIGGGTMQVPAVEAARRIGCRVYLADGNAGCPARELADGFIHVDLKDEEKMLEAARGLMSEGLAGVFTCATDFSRTVAYVAEHLGLPGLPYETALNASDKGRMRECFRRASVPHPRFLVVGNEQEAEDALRVLTLPLVVKPADNMGARGASKVSAAVSLSPAVSEATAYSRSGRVILEEFIEGPEYSIDALVIGERVFIRGVAERHIYFSPCFVELGHTIPAEISESDRKMLEESFVDGVRALGIRDGAAKGDVFLSPHGPVIGEIAARLSGGYMSGWTYPLSSGVPLTELGIRIALGESPKIPDDEKGYTSAERAIISGPGEVQEVLGWEEATRAPGIAASFLRVSRGDRVVFPRNNVEKCGNIISADADRSRAVEIAERAVARVCVRLLARDEETDGFLFGTPAPMHPSFQLSRRLERALRDLPAYVEAPKGVAASRNVPILDFPALRESEWAAKRDSAYRTIAESLELLDGYAPFELCDYGWGRPFWTALVRGGLQGALYVLDTIREDRTRLRNQQP